MANSELHLTSTSSSPETPLFTEDLLNTTLLSIFGGNPPKRLYLDLTTYRDAKKDIWKTKPAVYLLNRVKSYRADFYKELSSACTPNIVREACVRFSSRLHSWIGKVESHARRAKGFPRRARKATALEVRARSRNLTFRKYLERFADYQTEKNLFSLRHSLREIFYIVNISEF